MRTQLELPNEVVTELAAGHDAIMKTLEGHLEADVFLRGNVLTIDGGSADVETAETVVRELSDEELHALVGDAVAEAGASSPQEMGRVMSLVMPRVAGRAEGKRVSTVVREKLTA